MYRMVNQRKSSFKVFNDFAFTACCLLGIVTACVPLFFSDSIDRWVVQSALDRGAEIIKMDIDSDGYYILYEDSKGIVNSRGVSQDYWMEVYEEYVSQELKSSEEEQ